MNWKQRLVRHAAKLLCLILALSLLVAEAVADVDMFESVYAWTRQYEAWHLDELLLAAMLLVIGCCIDTLRKHMQTQREEARLKIYTRLLDEMSVAQAHNVRGLMDLKQRLGNPEPDLEDLDQTLERRIKRGFRHLESMERRSKLDRAFNSLLLGDFQPNVDPERFFRTQPPARSQPPQSSQARADWPSPSQNG